MWLIWKASQNTQNIFFATNSNIIRFYTILKVFVEKCIERYISFMKAMKKQSQFMWIIWNSSHHFQNIFSQQTPISAESWRVFVEKFIKKYQLYRRYEEIKSTHVNYLKIVLPFPKYFFTTNSSLNRILKGICRKIH